MDREIEVRPEQISDRVLDMIIEGVVLINRYPNGTQTLSFPADLPMQFFIEEEVLQ
jgi:hypothetical protein